MIRKTLLSLALPLVAACGGGDAAVRLGMAGPFTEGFGRANQLGAELAVEQINAAGGIDGRMLALVLRDDAGDGARAAAIAEEFVADASIAAVVGHVTSGAMMAAAGIYDGEMVALATTASSAAITGISPWVFRVISSDSANGADLARFAERLGRRRVAILYENDAYGRGLAAAFRGNFGGEVLTMDPIDADASDSTIYADWLAARAPDLVFVAGTERSGLALLAAARRAGVRADFLGGDGWTGVTVDTALAEGALVGAPFTAEDTREAAQAFVRAFREKHGYDPDGNAALAYDAVQVLATAIRAVGSERGRIRDWLASRSTETAIPGVTGAIAFQASGDPIGKSFTMTRVRGGALVPVEGNR
ncbi:MAG: ABC transporter substrate-binding protein [Gemmatimonadaceae bacterium]|nr:ABC transporter substrate-binding protein [Gemmatimonadaceae bacterium]